MKIKQFATIIALISNINVHAQSDQYFNSAIYKQDTTYNNVNIDGAMFTVKVVSDIYNDKHENIEDEGLGSPIHLIFLDNANKFVSVIDCQGEPGEYPYINYGLFKICDHKLSDNGKLYLLTNFSAGGSGSKNYLRLLQWKGGKITQNEIASYSGELDYALFNKNDQEILLMRGIWGENETHFANHKIDLFDIKINSGKATEQKIGTSKIKYKSRDESEAQTGISLFKSVKAKEPNLLLKFDLNDYCL